MAAMFLAGAVLALREAAKERQEEELVEREVASHRRIAVTAFLVIFLAEWGDLTQILTANLAAHYHDAALGGRRAPCSPSGRWPRSQSSAARACCVWSTSPRCASSPPSC